MRRALVAAVGMIGLVIAAGFSAYAVAAPKGPKKRAYTETVTGAQISLNGTAFENVFKATGHLDGTGAGIQVGSATGTAFPLSGTATDTSYFRDGVSKTKITVTLGAPDASGIETLTGSGKCVGGTRVHKKEKCTFTFSGTANSKTNVFTVKVTGTDKR
jgi:hypothetical protein